MNMIEYSRTHIIVEIIDKDLLMEIFNTHLCKNQPKTSKKNTQK